MFLTVFLETELSLATFNSLSLDSEKHELLVDASKVGVVAMGSGQGTCQVEEYKVN